MELLGAESGLVSITGFLWDCDVSPGTEPGREGMGGGKQRDEREVARGNHWGVDKEDLQR